MRISTICFALFLMSAVLYAQKPDRSVIVPYDGVNTLPPTEEPQNGGGTDAVLANELYITTAANYLLGQQDTGGGFPWTAGGAIYSNTQGTTARGMLLAYEVTKDTRFLDAAVLNGGYHVPVFPLTYTDGDPRFSTHTPLFLEQLSLYTSDPQYANFVQTWFWDKLTSGTYGEGNNLDAAGFGALVVSARTGQGIPQLSPWDLSATAIAAHVAGETAIRDMLMQKILAGLEATTAPSTWDVIGLAGAVWASAICGYDLNPSAGIHAAANSTADLAATLSGWTLAANSGAWLWRSDVDDTDPTNGDLQTTAFAVMALNAYDPVGYASQITAGVAFIKSLEEGTGELLAYPGAAPGSTGGVEAHAEALTAICTVAPSETFVDDDWSGSGLGDIVSGGRTFGFNAFSTLEGGIDNVSNSTVHLLPGVFTTTSQVVLLKNVSLIGAGMGSTVIKPRQNTGASGDSRGWFLVKPGVEFNLSQLTLDGSGFLVYQAIRTRGKGTLDHVEFKGIKYNESGPHYSGVGIAAFGAPDMNVNVLNSHFSGMGRIGVLYFGAGISNSVFSGNTYVGKGNGNFLDYALDISAGAKVQVLNNEVYDNRGVALSDGSISAAFLVTTYFGSGTEAVFERNVIHDNTDGIHVGFQNNDASVVTAHENCIFNNTDYGVFSTNPPVDASLNWWGHASGPTHLSNPGGSGDAVNDPVAYAPFFVQATQACVVPEPNLPNCAIIGINPGPPMSADIQFQDAGSGLLKIEANYLQNATLSVPPFSPGTTNPVIATVTKIDNSKTAVVILQATDVAGNQVVCDPIYQQVSEITPEAFSLEQNFPNPFNPSTSIRFSIPAQVNTDATVSLKIFDLAGREVKSLVNESMAPGEYQVEWNGDDNHGNRVSSGVYIYRLKAGTMVQTRKMTLMH